MDKTLNWRSTDFGVKRQQLPRLVDCLINRRLKTVLEGAEDDGVSDHPLLWTEVRMP